MKIDQLLTTLNARGVTQAALRAGNQMQLQINGEWQAQNATLTDESLSALIEEALEPTSRAAWDNPDGRATFERQGFSVAARRSGSAVQILIKQLDPALTTHSVAVAPVQAIAQAPVETYAQTKTQVQGLEPMVGWYYIDGESEKGPYPTQQLQMMIGMGSLPAQTLVWREGLDTWTPIGNTELAPHLPVMETMAPIASPTGGVYQPRGRGALGGNSSGSGEGAMVPPEVGGWNWGAFLLPVFWAFAHNQSGRAWAIFATGFIPFVGGIISFILTIMMAIEGNKLAWKHRRWDSVEHLRKTERVWMFWGLGLIVVSTLFFVLILALGSMGRSTSSQF